MKNKNKELFLSLVQQHFPETVRDGKIDFDTLKEMMGETVYEKYGFNWIGKKEAENEAKTDILHRTLKYKPYDSVNGDITENLYIEGDNLEVLKLLRKNYSGRIKMIYIDPPYNTGNTYTYNDNFRKNAEMKLKRISKIPCVTIQIGSISCTRGLKSQENFYRWTELFL